MGTGDQIKKFKGSRERVPTPPGRGSVKYNDCEFIGQNTTEYRSDRRYLEWEGEIITSIRRYLCQHEYGQDVAPYLYCAIDDSVMLDLHMQTMQHITKCQRYNKVLTTLHQLPTSPQAILSLLFPFTDGGARLEQASCFK